MVILTPDQNYGIIFQIFYSFIFNILCDLDSGVIEID